MADPSTRRSRRARRQGRPHQPRRQGRQGRPAVLVLGARRRRRPERPRRRRPRQGERGARGDPQGHRPGQEEPVPRSRSSRAPSRTRCSGTSARQGAAPAGARGHRRHRRRRGARGPRGRRHPRHPDQVARHLATRTTSSTRRSRRSRSCALRSADARRGKTLGKQVAESSPGAKRGSHGAIKVKLVPGPRGMAPREQRRIVAGLGLKKLDSTWSSPTRRRSRHDQQGQPPRRRG